MKYTCCFLFIFITVLVKGQEASKSVDHYVSMTDNGVWCWFSDPRAVALNDKIYSGWVADDGSVMVGSFEEKTGTIQEYNLYPQFNKDDHANPSFLILPDHRIMVFFSAHSRPGKGEKEAAITYAISEQPEDISVWQPLQRITQNSEGPMNFCYTNPIILSEEDHRIYVFWRGGDWKPTFCYSDDLGKTWSAVHSLIKSSEDYYKRPYMKITSNGKDEIHFAFTDGHPRNEPLNSIYYLKYKRGRFYQSNGTIIGDMSSLPLEHDHCDIVYNAPADFKETTYGIRSWIWDVAVGNDGNPTIAYTKLPTESEHEYWLASWTGSTWKNAKIDDAGAWFPRYEKTKSMREPEPHYSGGITISHHSPNTVYYSKPVKDRFEIFKAATDDHGDTWMRTAITSHSNRDNVRPFAIQNNQGNASSQVVWMANEYYHTYEDFNASIVIDQPKQQLSTELTRPNILAAMKTVANWQIREPLQHHEADWTNAALYAGLVEWAKLSGDSTAFRFLRAKGDNNEWAHLRRSNPYYLYFADDYAVGQMYVEMYRSFQEKKMISPMERYFDFILQNPSDRSLSFEWLADSYPTERWSWCDALFMGPTVWAKMANELNRDDYLNFMDSEYHLTYNYLYDSEEHLFFRDDRYFDSTESNGKKVFWGRGNGWVLAGLPIIIKELPEDWKGRDFYITLFKEMAAKVSSLQDVQGYWHASLLDPDSYPNPETSSSGFFTFALAWGINNGYLDKKTYQPIVAKAWQALVKAVYPNGKIGWVQQVGKDPKNVTKEMTEVYAVGAFLLAGTEVIKMVD